MDICNRSKRIVKCVAKYDAGPYSDDYELLEVGKKYTVTHIDTRGWYTIVALEEFPGKIFNSVLFAEIEKTDGNLQICYKINEEVGISDSKISIVKENTEKPYDNVTNPAHYVTGKFECIDVMTEVFGAEAVSTWCKINAFKYLYRCDRKNGEEDLKKAQWYLNKHNELIKELKKGDN